MSSFSAYFLNLDCIKEREGTSVNTHNYAKQWLIMAYFATTLCYQLQYEVPTMSTVLAELVSKAGSRNFSLIMQQSAFAYFKIAWTVAYIHKGTYHMLRSTLYYKYPISQRISLVLLVSRGDSNSPSHRL